MKKICLTVTTAFALAVLAQFALAATTTTKKATTGRGPLPSAIAVETTQVTATVVGVDQAKRTLTLKMPDGTTQTYRVGKEVRNFSQIKKGDKVNGTLVNSLAISVTKGGGPPTATETENVRLAPKGAKPGVIASRTYRISGKIQYIDYKNRKVTITGPNYGSKTFKVGPNVRNLQNVKPGDNVVVKYTEAIALNVQKP